MSEEFEKLIKVKKTKNNVSKRYIVFQSDEFDDLRKLISIALSIDERNVDLSPTSLRNLFINLLIEKAKRNA